MKEQEQNNQKQENQKATPDKKNLSGTERAKEKTLLEKASDTIAGDNQLMATVLKILLSPITLLLGAGLIIFCFFKMNGQKQEIEKLKMENQKLTEEKNELEEDFDKVRKKYKKLKNVSEAEAQKSMAGVIPIRALPEESSKKKTYQSAYLD